MNEILIGLIIGGLLFSSVVVADIIKESDTGILTIQKYEGWKVIKQTGNEANFDVTFTNLKDKKTQICFTIKEGVDPATVDTSHKYLYDINGNLILDDKGKAIQIKYELNKCEGRDGYHIDLTNAQAINIDNYIQLGTGTIILVYQTNSLVNYQYYGFEINTSLERCDENREVCGVGYPNVMIVNATGLKFGAEDTFQTEDTDYKYIFTSTRIIKRDFIGYYIETGEKSRINFYQYRKEVIRINTEDICNVENFDANCQFNLINNKNLEIYFTAQYNEIEGIIFIDPSYSVATLLDSQVFNTNTTTYENRTFLDEEDTTPYDDLIGYYKFDAPNFSIGTNHRYPDYVVDSTVFSPVLSDGVIKGDPEVISGMYGDALDFDGDGDYLEIDRLQDAEKPENITVSFWVNLNARTITSMGIVSQWSATANQRRWEVSMSAQPLDDKVEFGFFGTDNNFHVNRSSTSLSLDTWYHVATTYDSHKIKLYIDGVLDKEGDDLNIKIRDGTINADIGNSIADLNATLDDVMIFNTNLSASQISDIYNNQSARHKANGTAVLKEFKLDLDGATELNVTEDEHEILDSVLQKRLGEWEVSQGYLNLSIDISNLEEGWHMDESSWSGASGEVKSITGKTNGTGQGGIDITTEGWFYNAGDFDGSDDYVNLSIDGFQDTAFTMTFWTNATGGTGGYFNNIGGRIQLCDEPPIPPIVSATYGGWQILDNSGKVKFSGNNDLCFNNPEFVESTTDIGDGEWHHVVVTYNFTSKFAELYVDGDLEDSDTFTNGWSFGSTTPSNRIGSILPQTPGASPPPFTFFGGDIDEMRYYNTTLSESQVEELYIKGRLNYTYSSYQTSDIFTVSNISSDHFLLDYKFNPSPNNFYSPLLFVSDNPINVSTIVSDTCTAPASDDWNIDCADNCVWTSQQDIPDNVSITGEGQLTLKDTWNFIKTHWKIYKEDGCKLVLDGGKIG